MTAVPPAADPSDLLRFVGPATDVIVPGPNGEPVGFVDALEAAAPGLDGVRVHQLDCQRDREYHTGCHGDRLRHVSYFLSRDMRPHYEAGGVDLVPNDFHAIPDLLRRRWRNPLLAVAASPPDRHGYVSLGLAADYAAALLGEVPVVIEVNPNLPRTNGLHTLHLSDALGWTEVTTELVETPPPPVTDVDRAIAERVAERIPDGATLQIGIGAVPGLVAGMLGDHRDLGVHTEVLGDAVMGLIESGAVNGRRKARERGLATTTIVLGGGELYEWADENPGLFLLPVDISNDPRVISQHDDLCSINATMQVDLLGQCASESLGTHYVSSTGGQADFMRGAQLSRGGQSFIVTHSTAVGGTVSRIVPTLTPGAVVSAHKNLVDKVVTEHGIAELTGRTVRERTEALIAVADPTFRDDLERAAKELGYL
ncbi:acetyl-CoA hydrolase/transferase family protein [Dermatobacter hominis]|uniref:acetyl-CoA hydrolase/transferase family protein n=1 Tax=Dermatobacter hominis TaxID=2884263 RepID=UPI001D0F605F|nr:acetyl-CoA hydrolase/transferase C-terminal domain-containing protein [Dermatobacter hominis]UDY35705.1 propionyl-CoA--succinate CoA transferase [Dermatobacter hominis]